MSSRRQRGPRVGLACVLAGVVAAMAAAAPAPGVAASRPRVEPDFPVTATDLTEGYAYNSPVLVADPTDDRFVAMANRLDAPEFGCALQLSGDGGRTWTPARPVSRLPPGADTCYAPEIAFDRSGRLYYLFVALAGAGNEPTGVFLTTSADRGRSFTEPRRVLGPLNFAVRMAIDPAAGDDGRLHLVWLHATSVTGLGAFGPPPNPVLAAYSDDKGQTFSKPVQVSDASRERVVAPALALGPGHRVHVAYYDLGDDARDYQGLAGPAWDGTWALVVATSADGGKHFLPGVVIDDQIVPSERVMLVFTMPPPSLVTHDERTCAAWTDARSGDADAVLRCSRDAGRSWDPLRRLSDDRVGNGARQDLPRLAFAPNGRLDALFVDRRHDPDNVRNDVYFTSSADGGLHFSANVRVAAKSSDSRIGQRYLGPAAEGLVEWGSRLGLLAGDATTIAAWPDTRYSQPDTTAQELRSAAIVVASSGTAREGTGTTVVVGSVGIALAAGLILLRRHRAPRSGDR